MPAINLATISSLPYVYATTTPATINTCQLITLPNLPGIVLTIHNRDKASKSLRFSFDGTLTQGGAAPAMYATVDTPHEYYMDGTGWSGLNVATQLAIFSDSASVNCELIFSPAGR
jgi:hypothetical protein